MLSYQGAYMTQQERAEQLIDFINCFGRAAGRGRSQRSRLYVADGEGWRDYTRALARTKKPPNGFPRAAYNSCDNAKIHVPAHGSRENYTDRFTLRRAAAVARLSRRGRNCTFPFLTLKSITWIRAQSQHFILCPRCGDGSIHS